MYRKSDNKTIITHVGTVALTLLCATAAWIPAFIIPNEPLLIQGSGSLYRLLIPSIEFNPILSNTIALVLLVVMVGLQCWHAVHLRLVRTLSLLPALFILLFSGVLCSEHGISPGLLAGICIYIAFMRTIIPCNHEESLWHALEMGIFVSVASLFAPTYLLYLPLCIVGMHLMNQLNATNLLGALIGMFTPYILWIGFLFLTNQMEVVHYQWSVISQQFCIEWGWSLHDAIVIGIIAIALLVALLGFLHQHTDRIHPRAVSYFSFVLGFGALLLSLLYHNAHHSITLILFTSLMLTQYYNHRSKKITTVFFYVFIASLLFVYTTQFLS